MGIWDFEISYKILVVILLCVLAGSLTYSSITGDIKGGVNFYVGAVKVATKPIADYIINPAQDALRNFGK